MRRLVTAGSARWRRTRLLGRIVGAHRFRPTTHQHRTTLLTACQETRQAVAIRTATARIGPLRAARISNSPQPIPPGETQVTKASARFARNDVTAGHHSPAHSTPGDRPAHHDPAGHDPSRHRPAGHDPPDHPAADHPADHAAPDGYPHPDEARPQPQAGLRLRLRSRLLRTCLRRPGAARPARRMARRRKELAGPGGGMTTVLAWPVQMDCRSPGLLAAGGGAAVLGGEGRRVRRAGPERLRGGDRTALRCEVHRVTGCLRAPPGLVGGSPPGARMGPGQGVDGVQA